MHGRNRTLWPSHPKNLCSGGRLTREKDYTTSKGRKKGWSVALKPIWKLSEAERESSTGNEGNFEAPFSSIGNSEGHAVSEVRSQKRVGKSRWVLQKKKKTKKV